MDVNVFLCVDKFLVLIRSTRRSLSVFMYSCAVSAGKSNFERNNFRRQSSVFSSASAKRKWRDLEKRVRPFN